MKFVYLTDVHLKGMSPSKRKDVYYLSILKKLNEIGAAIKKENLDFAIIGGDLTDGPKISNQLYSMLAQILRSWKVPVFVVPGNHDLYGQNLSSIRHTTLGALASSGVVNLIARNNSPIIIKKPGEPIIAITGQEYYSEIDTNLQNDYEINDCNQKVDYNILVVHSMLVDRPFFTGTNYTLMKDVNTKADLVLSGHYHPECISKIYNNTKFIKPNSTARVEASKYNFDNKPCYSIIEITYDSIKDRFIEYSTALEGKDVFTSIDKTLEQSKANLEAFKNNLNTPSVINNVNYNNILKDIVNKNNISSELEQKIEKDINEVKTKISDNIVGYIPTNENLQISKVTIHNFQSHAHSEVKFYGSTVNAIMGESNKGKTSILRAIEWCLYNTPSGSNFIKYGETECYVEIEFSNGNKLKRFRTKSSSGYYEVYDAKTNKTSQYKGFSRNIPVEIFNIHQMPKISVGKNKISLNIAKQLEEPFLLSNSPFEKANIIGKFVGCDFIDETIVKVNKELLAITKDKNKCSERIEELENEIKTFDFLKHEKEKIDKLERIDKEMELLQEKRDTYFDINNKFNDIRLNKKLVTMQLNSMPSIDTLRSVLQRIETSYNQHLLYKTIKCDYISNVNSMKSVRQSLSNIPDVDKLKSLVDIITKLNETYAMVNVISQSIKSVQNAIQSERLFIQNKDKILNNPGINLAKMEELNSKLIEINSLKIAYDNCLLNKLQLEKGISQADSNIQKYKKELKDIFEELKICPICGHSLIECSDNN